MNVLKLSLHPDGLAPRIANLVQWRGYLFARLRQQIQAVADPVLVALLDELQQWPTPSTTGDLHLEGELLGVAMPFQLATHGGVMSFISTITVFGSPVDVTLQELAVESFFAADEWTAQALRALG